MSTHYYNYLKLIPNSLSFVSLYVHCSSTQRNPKTRFNIVNTYELPRSSLHLKLVSHHEEKVVKTVSKDDRNFYLNEKQRSLFFLRLYTNDCNFK